MHASRAARLLVVVALAAGASGSKSVRAAWPFSRPAAPPAAAVPEREQTPHPAVARIIVPEQGGATSYGSGTLVDVHEQFGLVVTNWHVVRDAADKIEVVFPGGFRSFAWPLIVDDTWDLAALVIWRPDVPPVPIAAAPPRPGEVLTIAGYGRGTFRAATGHCTQYFAPDTRSPKELVEVSVEARQGDSGGPILNQRGELAGVLFGASHGTTMGSYAGRVRGFLVAVAPKLGQDPTMIAAVPQPIQPQAIPTQTPAATVASTSSPAPLAPIQDFRPPRVPLASSPEDRSPLRPMASTFIENDAPSAVSVAPDSSVPVAISAPSATTRVTWRDLAGDSLWSQAKTLLALLGGATMVYFFFRFVG